MLNSDLIKALNEQIGSELGASNHYLAISSYFALQSLDEWAAFFMRQSDEERMHALKIIDFLIDNDANFDLPALPAEKTNFADALEAVNSALESERKVTQQFNNMASIAQKNGDFRGMQFLQWFIDEQVEEEASMGKLVDLVKSGLNLFQAQHFLPAPHEEANAEA